MQYTCSRRICNIVVLLFTSILSVLYNKDVYPTSSFYDPLLILLIYLNHIRLHKTLSYRSYSLYIITLLILNFIYLRTLLCVYILLLLSCFGCPQNIILFSIIPSSFSNNHTIYSYLQAIHRTCITGVAQLAMKMSKIHTFDVTHTHYYTSDHLFVGLKHPILIFHVRIVYSVW